MESNKNDNNNNGDNEHEQPQRTAQKRKLNELTKDEDKPPAAEEDQPEDCSTSKKNREEGNDLLDLELESLSREEFIKLVRKQMATTMEAKKQMETAKKEAEESAKKAEEFFQQNIQLEQEKAKLHKDLDKKMVEIMEMHKEMEEKSEELAEKAKQIDARLIQLNESTSHQHQMPTEQEMKIQLSLETWYDWLSFVPRHGLGQVVPMIGDRKFASIVQKFLHGYGEITIDHIQIVEPYEEDPSASRPRVRAWQNNRPPLRFEMAEAQMPSNIKTFNKFELSYFDQSVLNFMQKFQQNGLLDNVNLWFYKIFPKDIVQPLLCHILPLINGIVSIQIQSALLVDFYDAGNSKEIMEVNMKMMEKTRLLSVSYDHNNLQANKIDLYCCWLYQPARADGKPRMLLLGQLDVDYSPISLFIDRLKQDFLMAINPATFIIRIALPKTFQPPEAICLDNDKTKERFQTKLQENSNKDKLLLQISRYLLASTNKWIVDKEYYEKKIYLTKELKVVPL